MRSQLKSPFFWLVALALIAFAALLITQRKTLAETWEVLQNANIYFVMLLPIIQCINYLFIGGYYRTMFGFFETKIRWRRAWGVVASLNFVNQILPSGGISGITYLAYGFRTKLAIGKTTVIQMGRYVFAFLAYFLIGPLALLLLFYEGDGNFVSEITSKIQSNPYALVTLGLFILFIVLLVILFRSPGMGRAFMDGVRRIINYGGRIIGKKELLSKKVVNRVVNDFHEGLDFFKEDRRRILKPYGYMLLSASMELAIVYTSLLAVGADVSFAAVFASFLAANIAGVISVVPGDVGVHEAVMITMLVAFGVDTPEAISAVLLYRVFNKVIFLPIGFYFYTLLLKPAKSQSEAK